MSIFLTSDSHFFHTRVIEYCNRPFTRHLDQLHQDMEGQQGIEETREAVAKDVLEMNDAMVANWNAVVKPEDTVYHLGDFAFAARAVEFYTSKLNGIKHLISGNHDFTHSSHKKSRTPENRAKWLEQYKQWGWASVEMSGSFGIPGVGIFNLAHIPYASAYTEADEEGRMFPVRKHAIEDDGNPLLCGHIHEKWGIKRTPDGTLMINVGVDAPGMPWSGQFRPARLEEVLSVYNTEQERYLNSL